MGDSEITYACQDCKNEVASSRHVLSKRFHGSHGTAYLFEEVRNIISGEERTSQMTTGQHTIKSQSCAKCSKELGWYYVNALEPSQAYKIGKAVLERNLLSTQSRSPESSKSLEAPSQSKAAATAPPPSRQPSMPPSVQVDQSNFVLQAGIVLLCPPASGDAASGSADNLRVYMPNKRLPMATKGVGQSLEAAALTCATVSDKSAGFMPSLQGKEPFALTVPSLIGSKPQMSLPVPLIHWYILTLSPKAARRHHQTSFSSPDWISVADAPVACTSSADADMIQKAVAAYQERAKLATAPAAGEDAVYVDGSWDLVTDEDDDPDMVESTSGLHIS